MNWQDDAEIQCPYCGETISLAIDYSSGDHSYVEDCHVCCRPIVIEVTVPDLENISVTARPEND